MRFMILVRASAASEAGTRPDESLFAALAAYHEALARAGVLLDAAGLKPSKEGWRVRYRDGQARLHDGPFTESKEVVAGYTLIDVRSREEALEWARRFPAPHGAQADGEIEVRPLVELDELVDSPAVERLRAITPAKSGTPTALRFAVRIAAPRRTVWDTMLQPDSYRDWTRAFCEGSFYEGSWEQGARIRFLSPEGAGMLAEVVENRPLECIDLRFVGEIRVGADDGDAPSAWAGAHERYDFADEGDAATRLNVAIDVAPDHVAFMNATWPDALERLKALCEGARAPSPRP